MSSKTLDRFKTNQVSDEILREMWREGIIGTPLAITLTASPKKKKLIEKMSKYTSIAHRISNLRVLEKVTVQICLTRKQGIWYKSDSFVGTNGSLTLQWTSSYDKTPIKFQIFSKIAVYCHPQRIGENTQF